jgi:16S rRNA (adenine1518-N6/adenine1519-N6)-dimethyltransferase
MTLNYDSPSSLRAFLDERGLGMRKKYGQNFLVEPRARRLLLEALEAPAGSLVWEVGPGLGAMTRGLLERGLRVKAFELDKGFCRALHVLFADKEGGTNTGGFELVEGDVLKTWPQARDDGALYFLGNLPYTIGAVLIGNLIEGRKFFQRMVLTVQKETALRMTSGPASRNYSSFSVLVQSAYKVRILRDLKGSAFYPEPEVTSTAVLLELKEGFKAEDYPEGLYPLIRGLFASRRKTIRHNLRVLSNFSDEIIEKAGLKPGLRAEELSLDDFVRLAMAKRERENAC